MRQEKLTPVQVVGLDCDDPYALEKCLRRKANLFKEADLICGGQAIVDKLRAEPELSGRLLALTPPLEPLYEAILSLRDQGMKVVVLANGDPLFFGIGSSLVKRIHPDGILIAPAISSLQAACARLGLPWHNIYCISLHGRDDIGPLYDAIASGKSICILTGGAYSPSGIARILLDRGADWFQAHIFENMGTDAELISSMSIKECAKTKFGDTATILFMPVKKPRHPSMGLDERNLRGNYATKMPVRGAILELLNIKPRNVIWDIGAGSGALALEACAQAYAGRVLAIEKSAERCMDIQENRRFLAAVNLDIYCLDAPLGLDDLPRPDRIFMGGGFSGPNAMGILKKCAETLPRGGKFVASCVLLDSFMLCKEFIEQLGWPLEMMQVQASHAMPLGIGKRFSPINPVFLLSTQKP